jgi:hypothetical protein
MIACGRGWNEPARRRYGAAPRLVGARPFHGDGCVALHPVCRRDEAGLAAVLAFFFVARQPSKFSMTYEKLGSIENDLAMIKPRLTGVDGNGNPFVITADAAIQDAKNPKRARLRKIEADLTTDKNGWVNANAANGVVDMKAGSLEMGGGIDIFSDAGYALHSQAASVDLNKGVVHGHSEVTGQGPMGTMRADQFHYDRDSHQLSLDGHVKMTLIGNKK